MTPEPYTEDTLVQQTTADYLEQQLGWESIYAHNAEYFGPNSLLGRASDLEVVLTLKPRRTMYSGTCSASIQQYRRRITKARCEVLER